MSGYHIRARLQRACTYRFFAQIIIIHAAIRVDIYQSRRYRDVKIFFIFLVFNLIRKAELPHQDGRVVPDADRVAAKGFISEQGEKNGFFSIRIDA